MTPTAESLLLNVIERLLELCQALTARIAHLEWELRERGRPQ